MPSSPDRFPLISAKCHRQAAVGSALMVMLLLLAVGLTAAPTTAAPRGPATGPSVVTDLASAGGQSMAGEITVDPPIDRREAGTRWRWIGIKSGDDGNCPEPIPMGAWITTPLFEPSDNTILSRFCLYRNPAGAPIPPPSIPGLVALQPDFMAVAPSATDLGEATWPALAEHFLSQVGDTVGDLPITSGTRPRLAVIDTAANRERDPEDFEGTSPHGYALLNMVDNLLCESGGTDCVADLTSRLALAWECFDRNQAELSCRNAVDGGLVGLIGELAQAIQSETERWQDVAPSGQRLILNLSVGWERRFGGAQLMIQSMPVAALAAYRAIEDARCRGALVMAAAGNFQGGPEGASGPLYPGGWEVRTAPSFAQCAALGLTPDPTDFPGGGPPPYNPLVYSAAGVRADDSRLFNGRPGAEPRLVTFADHAAVAAGGGGATETLTGSSVATAMVSAAAAAVWYYRSDLAPFEVMNLLYDVGTGVGRSADFCEHGVPGNPCPGPSIEVRKVSVCEAVVKACTPVTADCPALPPTCPVPTLLSLTGLFPAEFEDPKLTLQQDWTEVDQPWGPEPACQGEALLFHPQQVPIDPCPHWQYHDQVATAWTEPQPGSNPCPNCSLNYASPGTLYLEVDDAYEGQLTDVTLKCGDNTYNLGSGTLVAGDKVRVTGIECREASPVLLGWTLNGVRSTVTPILEAGN